ncbi:MAG: hypothetical protein KDA28_10070 [Phycisphaerales bacterium]|nr:hypothetical protein [Phycisphaerales bacterium]
MFRNAFIGAVVLAGLATAETVTVVDDPNAEGLGFGQTDVFGFGGWGLDDTLQGNDGNDSVGFFCDNPGDFSGAGISIPFAPNDPAVLAANGGGTLTDGNIIRFSAWIASNPNDPFVTAGDLQADILKIEFWRVAFSTDRGADLIFDTEAFGGLFTEYVSNIVDTEWRQFVFEYEVNSFDVSLFDLAEIRPVFLAADFSGSIPQMSGSIVVDRLIVEVFEDQAAADASPVDGTYPGDLPQSNAPCEADYNGDTVVDIFDVLDFLNVFSAGCP